MWTLFWDMNSGGGQKEPQSLIFIEKPIEVAKVYFYNRFGHNPERVTCTCCGPDYSISEDEDLHQATAYHRHCEWNEQEKKFDEKPDTRWTLEKYLTLEEFYKETHVLIIPEDEIDPVKCVGSAPQQGYIWVD